MSEKCETCVGEPGSVSDEEFAAFCELLTEEGKMPAGRIDYPTGRTAFIDGNGRMWSQEAYAAKYGFDPAPVLERMRASRANSVKTVASKLYEPVLPQKVAMARPKPVQLSRLPQFR